MINSVSANSITFSYDDGSKVSINKNEDGSYRIGGMTENGLKGDKYGYNTDKDGASEKLAEYLSHSAKSIAVNYDNGGSSCVAANGDGTFRIGRNYGRGFVDSYVNKSATPHEVVDELSNMIKHLDFYV